jgi:predicted site-specific integrase-resolvase
MQITDEELRNTYYNNSNKECCKQLGVSLPTLLKYLEKAGIPQKGTTKKKLIIIKTNK